MFIVENLSGQDYEVWTENNRIYVKQENTVRYKKLKVDPVSEYTYKIQKTQISGRDPMKHFEESSKRGQLCHCLTENVMQNIIETGK